MNSQANVPASVKSPNTYHQRDSASSTRNAPSKAPPILISPPILPQSLREITCLQPRGFDTLFNFQRVVPLTNERLQDVPAQPQRLYPHRPEPDRPPPTAWLYVWPLLSFAQIVSLSSLTDPLTAKSKRGQQRFIHMKALQTWRTLIRFPERFQKLFPAPRRS